MENEFIKKLGCRLPFMDQLTFLKQNRTQIRICTLNEGNYTVANYSEIWKKVKIEAANSSKEACPLVKRCKRANYELFENFQNGDDPGFSDLILSPLDSTVQYVKDDLAYDTQSFIGEVGGTLGLMLGLSFISVIDFIQYLVYKFLNQ